MRIQGGPSFTRHHKDRPGRLTETNAIPYTVISRPRASYHEAPKRPRQSSSFGSQPTFLSSGQTNPQWMKTLEEKYRKLHIKIDSYGDKTNYASNHQNVTSASQAGSNHYRNDHKPLRSFDSHVDLVRLGKSVLRFVKKTDKSEYMSKSTRTLLCEQRSVRNKLVSIDRHSHSVTNIGSRVPNSTETSRQTDQDNSREQSEGTSGTCNGSFHLVMKTPRVLETINCNKQEYRCDEARLGVNNHSENNIEDNSDGYSVTNGGSDQHDAPRLEGTQRLDIETDYPGEPKYDQHLACPLNDNLEAYVELNFRPLTASPSCYSHTSTHRSIRSRRPKTSLPTSGKSSYLFYRDSNRDMAKNRMKITDRRKLNVLQGMSEEAKFAITETKKEMDSHSKTFQRNGSAPHSSTKRESKSNGARPKSEKVVVQHRLNGVDYNGDKQANCVGGNGTQSHPPPEVTIPASSIETLYDAESNNVDLSLMSRPEPSEICTKLPGIGQSISKCSAYSKQGHQSPSQSRKYTSIRRLAREKTFQITAPDYDVRFREILSCDIPESETPPPDIKAQAVAKCSEWLSRRCVQNSRVIDTVS